MNIIDKITKIFPRRSRLLIENRAISCDFAYSERRSYAELIWTNICDLLNDIIENVRITESSTQPYADKSSDEFFLYASFKSFVYTWGRVVWQQLFDCGFCVIAFDGGRFRILTTDEYSTQSTAGNSIVVTPYNADLQVYVMRSPSFVTKARSDRSLCDAWLRFLDDVLNGAATITQRLGCVVVASPKDPSNAPMAYELNEKEKKDIEKNLREDYGALRNQSNTLVLPRAMDFQIINLAGVDVRMQEKVRLSILAICDRIKVPANQVAIIEADASKSLSNGSELREGDRLKYASAKRLFERTFVQMALDLKIRFDYIFEGEPQANTTPTTNI